MIDFYYTESPSVNDENHRENTLCVMLKIFFAFVGIITNKPRGALLQVKKTCNGSMLKTSYFFRNRLQQTFNIAVTKRKRL